MFEIFKVLGNLFFKDKIIYINSAFQFINYLEYKKSYSFEQDKHKPDVVFLGFFILQPEFKIINNLNNSINTKKCNCIKLEGNIPKALFIFFLKIRGAIKNYQLLIIGDYNNFISKEFYKKSKKILLLDDGTNALNFKKLFKLDKKKLTIFSMFEKNLFNHDKYKRNKFLHLKSFIKYVKKKDCIYLLGSADVEKKIVNFDKYFNVLKNIKKKFSKKKIFYFPHPKENYKNYSRYKLFKLIKPSKTIESYLALKKELPEKIIGFNSTAFFSIKSIYKNKIKLENYSIIINSNSTNKYKELKPFIKKIEFYLKKQLKLKSKKIIV